MAATGSNSIAGDVERQLIPPALRDFLSRDGGVPDYEYGGGPNWKMRTLRSALQGIELDPDLLRHGLKREVFLAPVARRWQEYLRGDVDRPGWAHFRLRSMAAYYRARWAIPRASRDQSFRTFRREELRLTPADK